MPAIAQAAVLLSLTNNNDVVEHSTTLLSLSSHVVCDDGVEDDDDELSDESVNRLLREAEERMKTSIALSAVTTADNHVSLTKFPKLNAGPSLPKAPISVKGSVSRISDPSLIASPIDHMLANIPLETRRAFDPAVVKKKLKEDKDKTAGASWFNMPQTNLTPELKRDFQLIKMRNVLDPHRHYKKDNSAIPKYSQTGTVIEGSTEFFSARISKKERKRTIAEEIMADSKARQTYKRKYEEIQQSKRSGKKEFYKKLKEQRKAKK
ncbi:dTDP-fucopyranose mutase [Rhizina undulata]